MRCLFGPTRLRASATKLRGTELERRGSAAQPRTGAHEVEVVYHFLERADAVVGTTFARSELAGLEEELSAAIRRIDAGEFTPSPDEFTCNGCPALDVVCAGPKLRNPPERIVATV